MTWDFIRAGWPNTATIFALALLPIISVALQRADLPEPAEPTIELSEYSSVGEAENSAAVIIRR